MGWRALLGNPASTAGLVVLIAFTIMAVFAATLAPYSPTAQDSAAVLQPPGGHHLLGTDSLGRDLLSRVIYGARVSLSVSFLSVLFSSIVGIPIGILAAYAGGIVDDILMRLVDVLMAVPGILLAIAIVAAVGASFWTIVIAIGISTLPGILRLARAETVRVRRLEYVEAARAIGVRPGRIMAVHIYRNIVGTLLVLASLYLGAAILLEAGLSFLGLGVAPPTPTWGGMISEGREFVFSAPYVTVIPGLFVLLAALACNLVGDRLRDAVDPRSVARNVSTAVAEAPSQGAIQTRG